jgi:hypothetical protein
VLGWWAKLQGWKQLSLSLTERQLAGELGPVGPLHLTGLQINKVFKQMELRRVWQVQKEECILLAGA